MSFLLPKNAWSKFGQKNMNFLRYLCTFGKLGDLKLYHYVDIRTLTVVSSSLPWSTPTNLQGVATNTLEILF